MNPPSGDRYHIAVWPPTGLPYLVFARNLEWPKGSIEQSLDLVIPRGVAIRGRVTDEHSGEVVAGAALRFTPRTGAKRVRNRATARLDSPGRTARFSLGCPERGHALRHRTERRICVQTAYR